jgi:dTDP-4-amino-4,6-dideoxygalactose transaminase
MINVTKSFLPPIEEYKQMLDGIWQRAHLTNHGPLVNDLEQKLKKYLNVPHFYFLNNGTIAIQIAIKALELKGEIITTPFSYVATTSSIVWENCEPVFVDIDPANLTIDATKIEAAITRRTSAILATHVYGIPCNVELIEAIAQKHNIKVIYDAAHAFGVEYKNKGLLNYGDVSTLSFHATKLFHTVEGGGITANDAEVAHKISYQRNFGHQTPESFYGVGINGKNSEFHAAMGLCNFPHIETIISERKKISETYNELLFSSNTDLTKPIIDINTNYNYAYYPILFKNEEQLRQVKDALATNEIFARRYFNPSLNTLNYITKKYNCPVSENASQRVVCLPLYVGLAIGDVERVSNIILNTIK